MKANAPIYSLNGGEVSKIALSRVDVTKMRIAASCQLNWLPWVVGPMMLRPGTFFVGEVLNDQQTHLMRFVFSKLDTALIELTPNNMRVWVNEALITRVSVGTTIGDPFFSGSGSWTISNTTTGASATVAGGVATLQCIPIGGLSQIQQTISIAGPDDGKEHAIRIVITQGPVIFRVGSTVGGEDLIPQTTLDTGTHSLTFTPTGANATIQIESTDPWNKTLTQCSIEAAGVMQIPTSFASGDLPNVRYDQAGDIIYIACYGQQQRMIQRRSAHSWSFVLYYSNKGPFLNQPGLQANFTPGAYSGNTTITSDRPFFQPGHVGALFRVFMTGQQNKTVLGAQNAFSTPVRVTGVGAGFWNTTINAYQPLQDTGRNYTIDVTGTWTGTVTMQRSFESALAGFADVKQSVGTQPALPDGGSLTSNGGLLSMTGSSGASVDLDNGIVWERVGFDAGNYGSGTAIITTRYGGGGGYGWFRVTAYNSPTSVNVAILSQPNIGYFQLTSLNPTLNWLEGQWSSVQGFPTSVCFHEGRLFWFGQSQVWGSASDDFTNFADINPDGTSPGDSGAINVTLGAGPIDDISWGLSLTRLLIGREQSIGSCRSSNFDQPVTPSAIVIRDCCDQGAQRIPAVKVGKRGIFVQQSGRRVYELAFSPQELDYDDRDLTRLNLDIGLPGFNDIDHATQPDKMVFLPRNDGQCACLLYDVKDEVEAWWRLQTLGVIENVAVLPQNGPEDLVYFVVRRVINGVTRRFIERLAPRTNCVGGAINQQLDCHVVYQGSPTNSITLSQLPNSQVSVWADGAPIGVATTNSSGVLSPLPDGNSHSNIVAGLAGTVITNTFATATATLTVGTQYNGYPAEVFADIGGTGEPVHVGALTVSGGTITLPNGQTATTITACLGYVAPFMSAKLAYAAQLGSALTQRKRINRLGMVMYDTHFQGIQYGQRFDKLDNLPLMEADQVTPAGTVWSEFDEPMFEIPGEFNTDSRLCLLAQAPSPCTVGAVVIGISTNEK